MAAEVVQITPADIIQGEGPHWDCRQQALFWIDATGKTLNRYELLTGRYTKTSVDGQPTFIIPVEGYCNRFVISSDRKIVVIYWDGEDGSVVRYIREIAEVDQSRPLNKLNDGKVDPCGRLFTGTANSDDFYEGSFFRLDGRITNMEQAISISNGLAWDCQDNLMYYIDSPERRIRVYDYCFDTGCMSNRRYIFDMNRYDIEGSPDGCTIDSRGNLWVAIAGGSVIANIDPCTDRLIQTVEFPVKGVTSCTFGGPDRDILFVTTAKTDDDTSPQAGATFAVIGLGVKGTVNNNFQLANC